MQKGIVTYTADCEDCGANFTVQIIPGLGKTKWCDACREKRRLEYEAERQAIHKAAIEYQRREWLQDPTRGKPRRYWDDRWEDFRFDKGGERNASRVEELRAYAEKFPVDAAPLGQSSLLIASPTNGVGKTMLAGLILSTLVERYDYLGREICPFQFWSVAKVKMRLKTAERFGSKETPEDVYRELTRTWLLILDDVGKEQLGGYGSEMLSAEMYFNIIDQRYNNDLPIILTSNLDFHPWSAGEPCLVDLMGRAAVSRLLEMTRGTVCVIDGEDRR